MRLKEHVGKQVRPSNNFFYWAFIKFRGTILVVIVLSYSVHPINKWSGLNSGITDGNPAVPRATWLPVIFLQKTGFWYFFLNSKSGRLSCKMVSLSISENWDRTFKALFVNLFFHLVTINSQKRLGEIRKYTFHHNEEMPHHIYFGITILHSSHGTVCHYDCSLSTQRGRPWFPVPHYYSNGWNLFRWFLK